MPRCYLLAIAQGSALDRYTNNWTLFSLIEQVQVSQMPADVNLETHVYWEFAPDEYNQGFDMRLVLVRANGERAGSQSLELSSGTRRHRMRLSGLRLDALGECLLTVEWRERGEQEWNRSDVAWPLTVEELRGAGG
jgi:hypothetical protein